MVAAAVNRQDYYQHQYQQPMVHVPPVSRTHNPPPNLVQPTVVDYVHAQLATPVTGAPPNQKAFSPGRRPVQHLPHVP